MYRILLVDDESIILSGLQSMLKWEEHGCIVAGTARNGEQALAFIRQSRPDIVICDISMPLLSGLELLSRCAAEFPEIVFVMLTNYEDFGMARESLRNRAVDYLLKIDLDEDKLARSVDQAVKECAKRRKLARSAPEPFDQAVPSDVIRGHATALLTGEGESADQAIAGLEKRGAAKHCAVAELNLDPSRIPNIGTFTSGEKERLFSFHHKIVEDMAQTLFSRTGYVILHNFGGGGVFSCGI